MLVHGTCIEIDGLGVLLRAPSGGGKSDLALRLIDDGAHLVADDQVQLTARAGRLVATAPLRISGRMEVRGLGIVEVPSVGRAEGRGGSKRTAERHAAEGLLVRIAERQRDDG